MKIKEKFRIIGNRFGEIVVNFIKVVNDFIWYELNVNKIIDEF